MAFRGWSDKAIDFYDGLEEDNTKAYWQAHKVTYETEVKQPMEELLKELTNEFGEGKIFRPNRDVRFSADKSPYKTAIAGTLGPDGYVQLSAAGLAVGRGMYVMAPDQLQRYRQVVDSDPAGAELVRLVGVARRAGIEITAHSKVKTAPRGYSKEHPRLDLLCLKGLVTWRQWPVEPWLKTSKTTSHIVRMLRSSGPISDWLQTHVGPGDTLSGRE